MTCEKSSVMNSEKMGHLCNSSSKSKLSVQVVAEGLSVNGE